MLSFAVANLFSRPLRSILSTLGLTVAIAGMVGLFSIAEGLDQAVNQAFQQIPGLLVQQRGAPVPIFSTLPAAWEQELINFPGVGVVNAEVLSRINLLEGKPVISPPRFLLGLDIPSRIRLKRDVYRENVVSGRFLESADQGTLNCILSQSIAEEHKKQVGDTINIGGIECPVVGIYNSGSMMIDVSILMDLGSVRKTTRYSVDSVSCLYVEADGSVPKLDLRDNIEALFADREMEAWRPAGTREGNPVGNLFRDLDRQLRGAPSDAPAATPQVASATGESAIEVRTAEDWAERFDEFTEDLNLFLMVMTTIGVLIAVLSIVNTMLMSVTERTIDFGILRANGWRTSDIVLLITFESALIGLMGGLLGGFFGWLATLFINWNWPDRMQLFASPKLLAFSLLFSILMGIIGGVYPAWLAARLSPMEAIRRG